MVFVNYGYDGTIDEVAWANMTRYFTNGADLVRGSTDFAVSVQPGATRTVTVAAGEAMAAGVRTVSGDTSSIASSAVSSGVRWDLIALRFNWSPTPGGTTTVVVVEGGSSRTLPANRNNQVGVLYDMPLALVQYSASQTTASAIIDLRLQIIAGVPTNPSRDAKAILDNTYPVAGVSVVTSTTRPSSPVEGDEIYETNTDYQRVWDGTRWKFLAHAGGRDDTTSPYGKWQALAQARPSDTAEARVSNWSAQRTAPTAIMTMDSNGYLTVKETGLYEISAQAFADYGAEGNQILRVVAPGWNPVLASVQHRSGQWQGSGAVDQGISGVFRLYANDQIYVNISQYNTSNAAFDIALNLYVSLIG